MLRYQEREVWGMTPYKINTLFGYHKEYNPQQFRRTTTQAEPDGMDAIDVALGGF